ncbi:membrane protein insertion efficiency factor YidD [Catenulispora rubra]|uniref:membrane protein insertion efficiency factor YidD n=1 Tax=Catenulispora rubra TaxID=280293 RepID=UPI001E30A521|nr:membrane protein insertion efficiency factor YidD [Catenulispora rubra]
MDDEVGAGAIPDGTTGGEGRRRGCMNDPRDAQCMPEGCCESATAGGCLVGLTILTSTGGGLFAAVAGIGRTGRRLRSDTKAPHGLIAGALYRFVRYYQLRISSRRRGYGGCRYAPTCSEYAAEALRRYGALKGSRLAVGRLRRCRPGTAGGTDRVP